MRLWFLLVFIALSGWPQQTQNPQQQLNWQAQNGHAAAQYRLGNVYWNEQNRTAAYYWWRKAARQQFAPAITSLIHRFPGSHEKWLALAAEAGDLSAQRELAKAELTNKSISLIQWRHRWENSGESWILSQQLLLNRYHHNQHCDMKIKVIAADQGDKKRYLEFLAAVESSPFNSDNWCVSWVQDPDLSCTENSKRNRASCQSEKRFDKQVILAGSGIASASNQTLTLTPDSSEKVIQHELGHWMGLADEYEMSESLAREFCYGNYRHKSLNIIVTESSGPYSTEQVKRTYRQLPVPWQKAIGSWREIATQVGDEWVLGSSGQKRVGLYKADTCNAIRNRQAWRPVNERTAMEAHSTGRWPDLYLKLITSQ